jgi:L-ribulose-5-phosphate 4-epimerase
MAAKKKINPERELAEKVATGCRILFDLNLITFMGHVTARVPGEQAFLYGFNRHTLGNTKPSDVMKIGFDGKKIRGKYEIGVEWPIYTEIYPARPDVNCVIHAHLPGVIALYSTGKKIIPVTSSGVHRLHDGISIWQKAKTVDTKELGEELVRQLGNSCVCLIMGHGVVVVGKNVEETVFRTMELENQARLNLIAWQAGTPQTPESDPEPPESITARSLRGGYRHGQFEFYGKLAAISPKRREKLGLPYPVW